MERTISTGKRRIALVIQYDGTAFHGLQVQNDTRTVQGELESAIKILSKENRRVIASGRTDAGVHALGQVVHFDLDSPISLVKLCAALNGIMPKDVSVKNAFSVPPDFHSRYDAVEREYRYLVYNHPLRNPFVKFRATWVHRKIDLDYFRETAQFLVGEMDFASFCKKISADENTVRKINSIDVSKKDDMIEIFIRGNAFLHNMIRIIVGTIIDMHKDGKDPAFIKEILEKKDRIYSGLTAPPDGLYLNTVRYDPPLSSMDSAY
ncbi:MAG: tRNA pseudouridine(38-40) synthase TruA [bacterium]|nr:tRNA pseudouridine(38-40) synthase TruA [bacterium]